MGRISMKKLIILLTGFLIVSTLTSCGVKEVKSGLDRVTDPQVTKNELGLCVDNNSAFAFDLYRELADRDDNLLFSPYSLSTAMAMTWAGARDETEQSIAEVFHFEVFRMPQGCVKHPAAFVRIGPGHGIVHWIAVPVTGRSSNGSHDQGLTGVRERQHII